MYEFLKKNLLFLILVWLCSLVPIAAYAIKADNLTIVENGVSNYSIVLPARPSEVDRFAAKELQKYIRRISGAVLPIAGSRTPHSVLIGLTFAKKLGIPVNRAKLGYDGYVIKSAGNTVVLAGREERGTLYAVYSFLEKIGCRWYAPNYKFYGKWGGQYVPKMSSITFPKICIFRKPDYEYRKEYVEEGWTHTVSADRKLISWMAKVGMNTLVYPLNYDGENRVVWDKVRKRLIPELQKRGLLIEVGGHGYQNFLPPAKYFKKHPDWFGSWNGKRSEYANVVFNTANKEAMKQFTDNVLSYLKSHPEIDILDLWPPDGARWSNDSANLALGSPSDRQALLLNHVAAIIRRLYPRIKVESIAYSYYLKPPGKIAIDQPNILMDFCPISRSFAHPIWDTANAENARYDRILKRWLDGKAFKGEMGFYSYYTKYVWRSLPVVIPHLIQREMAYLHSLGVDGIGCFSEPGNWFTYELNHYTIAKASWNSDVNVDSLLAGFMRRRYGKAANYLGRYFRIIETTVPHANRLPGTRPPDLRQVDAYMRNFRKCETLLTEGMKAAEEDGQAQFLIGKLQISLRYAILDLEIRGEALLIADRDLGSPAKDISTLANLYNTMRNLFNSNLDKGIFISRGRYYDGTIDIR